MASTSRGHRALRSAACTAEEVPQPPGAVDNCGPMPPLAVIVAAALDLALGDPPNRLHPVAWMGRAIAGGRRALCHGGPGSLFAGGALVTLVVAAVAAIAGMAIAAVAARLGPAGPLVEGAALSLLLSVRGLIRAARAVAGPLAAGDLEAARAAVAFHLVSRATATLGPDDVASAAVAYRAVNTADAMLGYRDGPLEWFGKLAARLDDVLNFVRARLAALGLVAGALAAGENAREALWTLRRDGALTASPNAGRTMAAMAGALGLTLAKRGAYRLGDGRPPAAEDIARAVRVFAWAAGLPLGALLLLDSLALFLRGGRGPLGII